MVNILEIFFIGLSLSAIFIIGIIVYFRGREKSKSHFFAFFSFSLGMAVIAAYVSEFFPKQNPEISIFLSRLVVSGWAIASGFLCIFSFIFLRGSKETSKYVKIIIIPCTVLAVLSFFTPIFVKNIQVTEYGFDIIYSPSFYFIYLPILLFLLVLSFINFIKSYKKSSLTQKRQIQYLFVGIVIFAFGIVLFGVIIPSVLGQQGVYYRYGYAFSVFFIGLTALAILKYRLFDVKVVLTAILVFIIGIFLFVQVFIAETLPIKIISGTIFFFYCFFGYLLIRSVLREIELKEQLEAANKELKRLDEAKTEFLSIASHQLRTPLTAIKGYVAMIQEGIYGDISDKVKVTLDKVNDSSERLIRLVNSLLDISRLEMGRMEFDFKETQVEDLIQSIVDELYVRASKKKLKLIYKEPEKDLSKITIDPQKIRLVILNLIDNAIKYTDHGNVEIKVEEKNGAQKRILITVSDTGMGISKKDMGQLFKIYRRGTGVRLFPEGSGVGLYVAKKLVEAHKGKVWAKSEGRGKGSIFYVELPINGAKMQKFLKDF